MSAPHDKWDTLRKLLALKRHELPPPGFFDRLPDRIRARIEAETESSGGWAAWRRWFNFQWGFKPALAGAMLAAAAGLYVVEVTQNPAATNPEPRLSPDYGLVVVPAVVSNASSHLLADRPATPWTPPASLQPHLGTPPPPGLFRPGAGLMVSPAAFTPAGASLQAPLEPATTSNALHQVPAGETWPPYRTPQK
jgi:hypothetical protein